MDHSSWVPGSTRDHEGSRPTFSVLVLGSQISCITWVLGLGPRSHHKIDPDPRVRLFGYAIAYVTICKFFSLLLSLSSGWFDTSPFLLCVRPWACWSDKIQIHERIISLTIISFITFWDFSMFYQIFLSP